MRIILAPDTCRLDRHTTASSVCSQDVLVVFDAPLVAVDLLHLDTHAQNHSNQNDNEAERSDDDGDQRVHCNNKQLCACHMTARAATAGMETRTRMHVREYLKKGLCAHDVMHQSCRSNLEVKNRCRLIWLSCLVRRVVLNRHLKTYV